MSIRNAIPAIFTSEYWYGAFTNWIIISISIRMFMYAMIPMTTTFMIDFQKLNSASMEKKDFCRNREKFGAILLKSGVIGLVLNRKPTCSRFASKAATKAISAGGANRRMK